MFFILRNDALASCKEDRPLIIQFCGNDPDIIIKASKLAEKHCDAIDLNLGCPQVKNNLIFLCFNLKTIQYFKFYMKCLINKETSINSIPKKVNNKYLLILNCS